MTHIVKEEINHYCEKHCSVPSPLTRELSAFTHQKIEFPQMISGPQVASFLGFLIHSLNARRILEIGTYTGYSALCMAEQLPDSGEVITLDIDPKRVDVAKTFWSRSPHGKKIHSIIGPAQESLKTLSGSFDLVFIDADKTGYLDYLKSVLPLLNVNGVIVADNCLWNGTVLEASPTDPDAVAIKNFNHFVANDPSLFKTLVPIRDGLYLIRKA